MRNRYITFVLALTILTVGIGLLMQQRADGKEDVKKAMAFTLKNTEGKNVKLSDYRGQVVLIDVWATWCGYCVREIPDLVEIQANATKEARDSKQENAKPKLQIIGVSVDEDKQAVKRFVKEHDINYPIVYGDAKALKPFGAIRGLPTKFILNEKGQIVETIIGMRSQKDLESILARHLK